MDVVEPGTLIAGRYKVTGEIGRGGMGIVYEVEHVHTGELLALKALMGAARFDPQAVARFKREARASARIRSEHVVRVTDADVASELGGSPFLVMERLRGTDLEQYVIRNGPVEPALVVTMLGQVSQVLQAAHQLGIVHRDLKPENLFLHQRADGTTIAKVLDFGISKFVSADAAMETAGMTSTGSVLGTPLYMAPEQAHGQNDKIAPSTDIWAIGLVALRLLAGEHFWDAATMAELLMKIVVLPIKRPSERWPNHIHMSPALDAWFLQSCDRDQSKRWPSVESQMIALAAALGVETPTASTMPLALPVRLQHDKGAATLDEPLALADTAQGGEEPESDRNPALAVVRSASLSETDLSRLSVEQVQVSATASDKAVEMPARPRVSAEPSKPRRSRAMTWGALAIAVATGTVAVVFMGRGPEGASTANSTTLGARAAIAPEASSLPAAPTQSTVAPVVIATTAPASSAPTVASGPVPSEKSPPAPASARKFDGGPHGVRNGSASAASTSSAAVSPSASPSSSGLFAPTAP
jgi:serine/threonine protein kinase